MPNRIRFTMDIEAQDSATAMRLLTLLLSKVPDKESVDAIWQLLHIVAQSTRAGGLTTDGGAR